MKTIRNLLKILTIIICLLFTVQGYAQKQNKRKSNFVRVYNLEGKKINKGKIVFANDSVLGLIRNKEQMQVNVSTIGFVKTKRSRLHNVAVGSSVGASLGVLLGAATASSAPYDFLLSWPEAAAIGGIYGAYYGAILGGISAIFKKIETFNIYGDPIKWKVFKEFIKD